MSKNIIIYNACVKSRMLEAPDARLLLDEAKRRLSFSRLYLYVALKGQFTQTYILTVDLILLLNTKPDTLRNAGRKQTLAAFPSKDVD